MYWASVFAATALMHAELLQATGKLPLLPPCSLQVWCSKEMQLTSSRTGVQSPCNPFVIHPVIHPPPELHRRHRDTSLVEQLPVSWSHRCSSCLHRGLENSLLIQHTGEKGSRAVASIYLLSPTGFHRSLKAKKLRKLSWTHQRRIGQIYPRIK